VLVVGALLVFTYTTEWASQFGTWLRLVEPLDRLKSLSTVEADD
jgi:hypothetical protein